MHVALHVAQEVHGAALPGAAEHLGDRLLQALVGVGDAEPHAVQAAGQETAQELAPEGLGLGLADVDADHLAASRLVHAVGDHERLVTHAAALAHALHLGIEPEVGVAALERALAEDPHLLVERAAEAAHRGAAHALDAELGCEALDLARTDAVHVGLGDHRDQSLL